MVEKTYLENYIDRMKRSVNRILERIGSSRDISEKKKKAIFNFVDFCFAQGLKYTTIRGHLLSIEFFARQVKKDFEDLKKSDIIGLVGELEKRAYSEEHKRVMKCVLKKFYKWLRGAEDIYPEEVKWIKTTRKNSSKRLPDEILKEEEIAEMVNAAENIRDKAIIGILYDSGCRNGEFLSMLIKHVDFGENDAHVTVDGKTGMRKIPIAIYISRLASWLEVHPLKDDPEAPLWVSLGTRNRHEALGESSLAYLLERVAKKANIKKRVNPHSFRHARATHLAEFVPEVYLRHFFGWTPDSNMTSTYVHLSGGQMDAAILGAHGLKSRKEATLLKPKACLRCETVNSPDSRRCKKCGLVLDPDKIIDIDAKIRQANDLMITLMKDKEVREVVLKRINELNLQDQVLNL